MKRLSTILLFLIIIVTMTVGCANILDDYFLSIQRHDAPPYTREPVEQISVSAVYEFEEVLIDLIMAHEPNAQIIYHHFGTENIQVELEFAAAGVIRNHPIGAYAVSSITVNATRIVTYFEVNVAIEYSRTIEEIEAIVAVPYERYMVNELTHIMSQHTDHAIFRSTLQLSEEKISTMVKQIYYQNPGSIVMLPFVTVEKFPETGDDRIYLIQFSYMYDAAMMMLYSGLLSLYVEQNAGRVTGETDSLKLLELVRLLVASTEFNEGIAETISAHGAQNFSATAFGALVSGNAVGEGFAMAFKALSDEIGFDNRVVLGYLDGRIHAWNIVELEGYFYHIDVAMSAVHGIEVAFLKTDDDFEAMGYEWTRDDTVAANGPLRLEDILALEETDEPYDGEYSENDAENNETESGEPYTPPDTEQSEQTPPQEQPGSQPGENQGESEEGNQGENQSTEEEY